MGYRLVKVNKNYYQEIVSYRQELLDTNSALDGTSGLAKEEDIHKWHILLKKMERKETCPPLLIPATHYLLVDGKTVYGMVNIRHFLDDQLKIYGGHIGYNIRPKYRHLGFGTLQLKKAIAKAEKLNIHQILIMCKNDNIYSQKVILNNRGKFIKQVTYKDLVLNHYMIEANHE